MKIFAYIGYREWYEIPDSSLLRSGQPFFIPDFADEFGIIPVVMVRIGKLGKNIGKKFASRYIDSLTIGGMAVAEDLLREQRSAGLPWTPAIAFDKSVFIGKMMPAEMLQKIEVRINGEDIALSCSADDAIEALCDISKHITLKDGDLIIRPAAMMEITPIAGQNFTIEIKHDNIELEKILDIHIR